MKSPPDSVHLQCGLEMSSLLDSCYEIAKKGHTYPVSSDNSKNRTVNVKEFHPKSAH